MFSPFKIPLGTERTEGDVWWLSKADAFAQGLTYVNSAGNAIMKVDNMHNVVSGQKRNSVRLLCVSWFRS